MKDAEVNDVFRRIQDRRQAWKGSLTRLEINDYLGIPNLNIDFPLSVNALVGSNGSGKTRTLAALFQVMTSPHIAGVTASFDAGRDPQVPVFLIGAAEKTEIYKEYFSRISNINDDILNGIDPLELTSSDLADVNYILCRSYTSVSFYETEPGLRILGEDDQNIFSSDTVPFFSVSSQDGSWDTRSMGAGEYAALFIWWSLRNCQKGQAVLIEEPETYLSYAVQERLANYIARIAWDKKLNVFISTHSYTFIAKLPEQSIKPLLRDKGGAKIARKGKIDILNQIGAPISLRYLCIVEDASAKFFVEAFLERFFPMQRGKTAVQYAKGVSPSPKSGASGVANFLIACRHIDALPLEVFGLFDGDQENEASFTGKEISECSKGLLPGKSPLDKVFTEICRRHLDKTTVIHYDFPRIFDEHEGSDFHDHLRKACHQVGLPLETLWRFCFGFWVEEEAQGIEALRKTLARLLKVDGAN